MGMASFIKPKLTRYFIFSYLSLILCIISLIELIDMEVYTHWGEKFDVMHLLYLRKPTQITNSINLATLWMPLLLFIILIYCNIKCSRWFSEKIVIPSTKRIRWKSSIAFFFLIALSLLPIRGGFSLVPLSLGIPINVGAVYFDSQNLSVNHAAINTLWNFGFSIKKILKMETQYHLMPEQQANSLFQELNGAYSIEPTRSLVLPSKPNVLLIILEGFSANGIEVLGGKTGVTPQFNRLSHEGVLFTNYYASGHRSNRGIGSIFSSYPGLPYDAIIENTLKTQRLPHLMRTFKNQSYNTAFYYGGEINFANLRAYFSQGKADLIKSKSDFPFSTSNSKWGVHDGIMFDTLFNDLQKTKNPFFYSLFTLSSHEPFDIPIPKKFGDQTISANFQSSMYYTDQCLGNFIEKAKKTSWWNNTLIVILADHGNTHIGNTTNGQKETFHIPMLWLGGALNVSDTVVSTLSCQLDLAPTLLQQLRIDHTDYFYGRNIFSPNYKPRAYYSYGDGFGVITDSMTQIYNAEINTSTFDGSFEPSKDYGKAVYQFISNDFLNR
jgi:phosphoglycerol transferase MdoB-like AlkP superfamily enzyme